jgi:hypothetical protein
VQPVGNTEEVARSNEEEVGGSGAGVNEGSMNV